MVATASGGWVPPRAAPESPGPARPRRDPRAGGDRAPWWSADIARTAAGVVVTVRGEIDHAVPALLEQLLVDLVVGQGNKVVTVDAQQLVARTPAGIDFAGVAGEARARGSTFTVVNGHRSTEGGPW